MGRNKEGGVNLGKVANVRFCWLVFIAILIAMAGCTEELEEGDKALLTPADMLPYDNDISGWIRLGTYDEANDYDGLYDLIDGGAEVFIDNGFVSAAFQIYNNCEESVCTAPVHLRIYDQGNEANAQAVYDKAATGIGIPWDGAGAEARVDESGLASYMVEFWRRSFFVQVIIEDRTEEALSIAKLFASHVSREIG
jgi:hypothetical protein